MAVPGYNGTFTGSDRARRPRQSSPITDPQARLVHADRFGFAGSSSTINAINPSTPFTFTGNIGGSGNLTKGFASLTTYESTMNAVQTINVHRMPPRSPAATSR